MADEGGRAVSARLLLVRHGQSIGNVERRLDTRPPGSELTELGREQARGFAEAGLARVGLLVHSVATRAAQTAQEIATTLNMTAQEVPGIHEAQVGDFEDRSDDAAIAEFTAVYQRWHDGQLDASLPGGESGNQVLDRYVPVLTDLRMRYLDDADWAGDLVVVSHGAAIRLAAAVLAGVDSSFVLDHPLGNAEPVVLAPITDGRWSCVQWGSLTPPFYPDPADGPVTPVADAVQSSTDPMG